MKLLELTNVSKSYSEAVSVLDDVTLSVSNGETVALVGPSGSGKTTLITLAAGLSDPTSGVVKVCDTDWSTITEAKRSIHRRKCLGVVFQHFELIETLTALENVSLPLGFAGAKNAEEKAKEALEQVGLGHRLTHLPSKLSGGEKQRVGVARACVMEPRLIIADEPTGNLDRKNSDVIFDILLEQPARLDAGLLVVTHDMELAKKCSKIYKLIDGKICE